METPNKDNILIRGSFFIPRKETFKVRYSNYYLFIDTKWDDEHTHLNYDYNNPNYLPQPGDEFSLNDGFYFEPNIKVELDGEEMDSTSFSCDIPSIMANRFEYKYNSRYKKDELYFDNKSIAESYYIEGYWWIQANEIYLDLWKPYFGDFLDYYAIGSN